MPKFSKPNAPKGKPRPGSAEDVARKVSILQKATAALATVAVGCACWGAFAQANANSKISAAFSGTREAVVASRGLSAGDEIKAEDLAVANVPESQLADGALTPDDLADPDRTPVGRRAAQYVASNSQLCSSSVAYSGNASKLSASIEPGYEAVSVAVDAESGISGMLRTGDRVRVLAKDDSALGASLSEVCAAARVAALDSSLSNSEGGYSTVTLEVSPDEAEAIRAASKVTLTLPSAAEAGDSRG